MITVLQPEAIQGDPGAAGALDERGNLRIMPAEFYHQFSPETVAYFAVTRGLYSLPTTELVDRLKVLLAEHTALEIGAGNGVLARALGVRATDNFMQTWPEIAAHYASLGQAAVPYGAGVENLDAHEALQKYRPDVVLACWVTHRYDPARHEMGGNMYGVDEEFVLQHCKTYIHVGNSATHRNKAIRSQPHRRYRAPWLVSRSMQPELNEISIWGERLPSEPASER